MTNSYLNITLSKKQISYLFFEGFENFGFVSNKGTEKIESDNFDLQEWTKALKAKYHKRFLNQQLQTNVIFEDNFFDNLEVKLINSSLSWNNQFLTEEAKVVLSEDINQKIFNQKTTPIGLNKYRYILLDLNNQEKEYRQFPIARQANQINCNASYFVTKDEKFDHIYNTFKFNLPNVEFSTKSQLQGLSLSKTNGYNLFIDVKDDCATIFFIYNSAVIMYKQISMGIENIFARTREQTNSLIPTSVLKSVLEFVEKNQDWEYNYLSKDVVVWVKEIIDQFCADLLLEINQFLKEKSIEKLNFNIIAVGGAIANVLCKFLKNKAQFQFESPVLIEKLINNEFKIDDKAIEEAILLRRKQTNKLSNKVFTQTENISQKSKPNFFEKIFRPRKRI
ncbi:MAG3720 family protein [Mycoplasma sp. Ms02]|uniref:MAG3720 family protein n=1 Tax=Mycoplasma sp. Ms02 TaxID=353851 RepID=UPI001C8AF3A0|nr:hypothetical protein [Mycoplasma sp. Ms02]QZE12509.1 hypothetical protein K4L35_00755 [Mycoplasma sp. Ms02]